MALWLLLCFVPKSSLTRAADYSDPLEVLFNIITSIKAALYNVQLTGFWRYFESPIDWHRSASIY